MLNYDLVIVGGGPAGLAAAISAREAGVKDIIILERESRLGGILNQCIHNGFGLHYFKEELTGPEYADRFIKKVIDQEIEYKTETMVIDINSQKQITAVNSVDGILEIQARAVILAMGCRERPRGALNIPGSRCSGIYTAGTAQKYVNINGMMPGKTVVILGSGDIGLIMARRMTLEGADVKAVVELMPYSSGLKRNIVQCLDDFGIPLKLSHTITKIKGSDRLEGVYIAEVDNNRKPIISTEEFIPCDTLLLSVGLIPETELCKNANIYLSDTTGGAVVDEGMETNIDGIFVCGNVLHVHDLVDNVSEESFLAGYSAAKYLTKSVKKQAGVKIISKSGVRYTVPSFINKNNTEETIKVKFRVDNVYKDVFLSAYVGDTRLRHIKKRILTPGEMETILLNKKELFSVSSDSEIIIQVDRE